MANDDQIRDENENLDEELTEIDGDQMGDPLDGALSTDEGVKIENRLAAEADPRSTVPGPASGADISDENTAYGELYARGVDEADTAERREADNQPQP